MGVAPRLLQKKDSKRRCQSECAHLIAGAFFLNCMRLDIIPRCSSVLLVVELCGCGLDCILYMPLPSCSFVHASLHTFKSTSLWFNLPYVIFLLLFALCAIDTDSSCL